MKHSETDKIRKLRIKKNTKTEMETDNGFS